MNNLIKEKKRIENEILLSASLEDKQKEEIGEIEHRINRIRSNIKNEKIALHELEKFIKNKEIKTKELTNLVNQYRSKYNQELKTKYISKYGDILKYINSFSFDNIENIPEILEKTQKILRKTKIFPILSNKINSMFIKKKDIVIKRLICDIDDNVKDIENIHKASYYTTLMIEIESILSEDIFVDYCFKQVYDPFVYNFLSDKKTNRMDKPEWFTKFLVEKIKTEKRKLTIYDHLNPEKKVYVHFMDKIKILINLKINEIMESSSTQKRNLLLHFADEIMKFTDEIFDMFCIRLFVSDLSNFIIKNEKNQINKRIEEINLGNYKNWFKDYKLMINESLILFSSISKLDPNLYPILSQYILDNIYLYCEIFIKQIRMNSKDEVRLLCFLFSEIESFKIYTIEKADEYVVNLSIKDEVNHIDVGKLSVLNNENLRMIKDMSGEEIVMALKRIKNFLYISDKQITHTLMEIFETLNDYKRYLENGYVMLEKHLGEMCDDFILNNLIFKIRFCESECKRFIKFLTKIKEMFKTYKVWKCDMGCNCIDDIFHGRKPNEDSSSFFNIIYKNYEFDNQHDD